MKCAYFLVLVIAFSESLFGQVAGLRITGDPSAQTGATWIYQDTVSGVIYDLQGILYKPSGNGPFPAVIINHGTGGNANAYGRAVAQRMIPWGYVCIATNLTHAANAPIGSPGDTSMNFWGASNENMLRSMKCWDILSSLAYIDTNCIATFGHSRGAWVTTAIAGTYPSKFSVAGHTAGGIYYNTGINLPTAQMAGGITAPYIMHHGTNDNAVHISKDKSLDSLLQVNGIAHYLYVYQDYDHSMIAHDSLMYARTKAWFDTYNCKSTGTGEPGSKTVIYPNPCRDNLYIENAGKITFRLYNLSGILMLEGKFIGNSTGIIPVASLSPGLYFLETEGEGRGFYRIIVE